MARNQNSQFRRSQKCPKSVPETSSKPTVTASQKSLKIAESWRKGRKFTSKIDVASTSRSSTADPSGQVQEPLNLFQMFWDDEFFLYIKQQSELYAKQITPTSLFEVSVDELKVFFAIIFLLVTTTCQDETCTGVWMKMSATKQWLLPCRETDSGKFCGIFTLLTIWLLRMMTSTLKFDLSSCTWTNSS